MASAIGLLLVLLEQVDTFFDLGTGGHLSRTRRNEDALPVLDHDFTVGLKRGEIGTIEHAPAIGADRFAVMLVEHRTADFAEEDQFRHTFTTPARHVIRPAPKLKLTSIAKGWIKRPE